MNECRKHIGATIQFDGSSCPVCATSKCLWDNYSWDFVRGISEGIRNLREFPGKLAHRRSVYDYPNRKETRGSDGYLIKRAL